MRPLPEIGPALLCLSSKDKSELVKPYIRKGSLILVIGCLLVQPLNSKTSEPTRNPERLLTVDQLREDLQSVVDSIEQIHPAPYYFVPRETILRRERVLRDQLTVPETSSAFYRQVGAFVIGYGDDHTEIDVPPSAVPLKPPIIHTYAWRFRILPERIGYLDIAWMSDAVRWREFLRQTFLTLQHEKSIGLIVDLRTNTGGNSQLGDELLAYISDKPYRSISRKIWRFSPQLVAELNPVDPWGLASNAPDQAPPPDFRRLFEQRPPFALRMALRERAPESEKHILERWAPHWLDVNPSTPEETDRLTLDVTEYTKPATDFPLRYHGAVVFLIGPQTFSSAVILANTVEDFHLAPLVGEETKPCNQFGEPCTVELPNSRLRLHIATAQYVRANGDAANRHGVQPSIVVRPSAPNSDIGHDFALVRAIALVETSR